jgi:hypothetical protein
MGANTDACGVPGPVLRQADGDRSGLYWTRDGTPNPDARRFPVGTTSNPTLLVNAVTLDQLVPASGLCATVSQSPPGGILLNCCFLFPRWLSAQYPRGASIGAASSTLIVKHGIPAHQWLGHQWCKGTEDSPTRGIPDAERHANRCAGVLAPSADALALGAHRIQQPIRPPSLALAHRRAHGQVPGHAVPGAIAHGR